MQCGVPLHRILVSCSVTKREASQWCCDMLLWDAYSMLYSRKNVPDWGREEKKYKKGDF